MENKIPSFLLEKQSSVPPAGGSRKLRIPFIEHGIHRLAFVIKTGYVQWESASTDKFFQRVDARIKLLFLIYYAVIVSLKRDITSEVMIGVFIFILALVARLNLAALYKRVFFFGFVFGFLVALPSAFNVVTRGEIIFPLIRLAGPHDFWMYRIPSKIGITREGVYGVVILTSRVMNSLALSFFVVYTTSFPEIIKALRMLKVPDSVLMIITLSYKYVFTFAKTVEDIHFAKKSRMAGSVSNGEARKWIAGRIVFLFRKTQLRCEEIFKAMLSRGFSEETKICGTAKLHAGDWMTGTVLFLAGIVFLYV
jgi:cobalt/nickel transport system permease protein